MDSYKSTHNLVSLSPFDIQTSEQKHYEIKTNVLKTLNTWSQIESKSKTIVLFIGIAYPSTHLRLLREYPKPQN